MDIIGSIQQIENRLGGYNPKHNKSKPAIRNTRSQHAAYLKNDVLDAGQNAAEQNTQLGRNIDTIV